MRAVRLILAASLVATPLPAQSGGTLTGLVRDTAKVPIAGADVWILPGGRRVRTDSAGRYTIGDLDNGSYSVTARKLGYSPESWDAKLSDRGRLELNFTLRHRPLDTVRVVGKRGCDGFGVTGFECRRGAVSDSGGHFLDYPDIDFKNRIFVVDLFRDIPGFRVTFTPARRAIDRHPYVVTSSRCIASYVDGRPANITNPIPEYTKDLVALEIYPHVDSIPLANRRALRVVGTPLTSERCRVVVYWTQFAPVDPAPRQRMSVGQ